MNKKVNILIHILGCATFLALPVLFSPDLSADLSFIHVRGFQQDFLFSFFLLLFFYLSYYFLVPKFYFHRKYFIFFSLTAACFILIFFLPQEILPRENMQQAPLDQGMLPHGFFVRDLRNKLFQFLIMFFFSLMLRINHQWRKSESEKVDAELSYLKAQINPHFLFNTLNSIYSLAITQSENTASSIVKLSNMMRYILSESSNDTVSLEKEIDYIRSFIELQQIRFGTFIDFECSITGDAKNKVIGPLVLIPFIENAYKHGVNAEENSTIRINIDIGENELTMYVMNNKVHINRREELKSGLGVENTRNRLQMLYPGRHKLEITDDKKEYSVTLTLQIT